MSQGRVTRAVALIAFCIICVLPLTARAAEQGACDLKRFAEVDMIVDGDNNVVIPITLQGSPAKAQINLGSAFNSVGPRTVETLQLRPKPMPSQVTFRAGGKEINRYTAATLEIGGARFQTAQFLITTDPPADASARLGMDLFDHVDLELDFGGGKLRLFSQDHCPGHVVYWAAKYSAVPLRRGTVGDAYLIMELEGRKIETMIATGGDVTGLAGAAAESLFGIERDGPGPQRQQFMDLTSDGIAVMNAQVDVLGTPGGCRLRERIRQDQAAGYDGCYNMYPLMLGMNVLRKMRMYFATKEGVLYFTPTDAHR